MNRGKAAAEIELIEAEAWAQLHLALPSNLRRQLGCDVARFGGALSVRTLGADVPSGNRTIGLGVETELTEPLLSKIVDWYASAGIKRWLLDWSPEARPRSAETWFAHRGGRAMTPLLKLWRRLDVGVSGVERSPLAVVEIDGADARTFEEIVADPLGFPRDIAPVVRSTVGDPHWRFYVVRDGARPIAGAAMFIRGEGAWLGLSATLPSDRGRGAQTALLARRFRDAAALGCAWVSADTQPETAAQPNPSYRNMRRAGMDVLYPRAKYLFEADLRR
ncbi:MAG TPA: GNAT family N-acetyltransferase [Gemmatimonadaceae bacterium]|nr:GNAT family N-acetyltransferase [Gemmatimonadaceae bacterium]